MTDPELHGTGYTPLGRSLFYARMYYENLVQPTDPKGSCRQNVVILVTDGAETCDETTAPNNTFVTTSTMTPPTDLCTGGGNYNPFHPVAQACLLRKAGIKVYVMTDTTTGAANDTIAAAGGTGTAVRVSLTDANAAETAIVSIIASTVPPAEVCNGRDDNCNGLIDEGVSNMCTVAMPNSPTDPDNLLGTAARHCAVESCNCIDDDCDGQVDEGFPLNACGQPCGCAVPTELCDGLDNDCDGDIDEGFMVGASCTGTGVGICRRDGILACNADGTGTFCDTPTVTPQTEVCNGLDDDCDGHDRRGDAARRRRQVRQRPRHLPVRDLRLQHGPPGLQRDRDAAWSRPATASTTTATASSTTAPSRRRARCCLCPGLTQAQIDAPGGTCKAGRLICRGMMGFVCEGCTAPTPEVCDGKDNNCDGMIDTQAMCPSGFGCRDGQCILQCVGGEMPCPPGYKCVNAVLRPAALPGRHLSGGRALRRDQRHVRRPLLGRHLHPARRRASPAAASTATIRSWPARRRRSASRGAARPTRAWASTAPAVSTATTAPARTSASPASAAIRSAAWRACASLTRAGTCPAPSRSSAIPLTAKCETDRCAATQCGAGMACVPQTNTCKPDPCKTIVCPSDCWTLQGDG